MAENMLYNKIIEELDRNRLVFENLLTDKTKEEYLWKPASDKWCLLEIICHLHDEEKEDFRARIKHTFETPADQITFIDPASWVESRKYIQQNYNEILSKFLNEREQSIKWLRSLSNPGWDNFYEHQKFGKMTAKMFLTNWLAHDYLHVRQILNLKFMYLKHFTSEELTYAGNW